MDTLSWILIVFALIIFVRPILFQDRSPIPETSQKVVKVTETAELDAVLSSNTCVVVDFYADWCPPCRTIAPIFSNLAEDNFSKGKLAFAKVNVSNLNDLAQRYSVTAMPTFVFFRDGVPQGVNVDGLKARGSVKLSSNGLVDRILGADKAALEATVQALSRELQS